MEALHELMSVLCDPEGKVCINGSPADLEIIQKSLAKLQAERDALAGKIGKAHDLLARAKAIMEFDARRIAALEEEAILERNAVLTLAAQADTDKARIAELEADYETMRGACGAAQNRILDVARERDAAKAQLSAPRPGVNWCLRSHKQAERICELLLKVASLEAQLTACTQAHYGQMADEASAGVGGTALKYGKQKQRLCARCMFGERPCASQSKKTYVSSIAGDSCTGFAERPQTQGL